MMRLPALLATALPALALAADPASTPDDFAFGFPISAAGEGAVWELTLPEDVHRQAARADLGDLRVFNGAGAVVPHALGALAPATDSGPEIVALPFFPLRGGADPARGTSLRITTDERGAVIEAEGLADPGAGERVTAYLIDASALERDPRRLAIDWDAPAGPGFAATVAVETSDDLARWRTLVPQATLAELTAGEARLSHREIALPPGAGRYLRVAWPEPLAQVTPTGVTAVVPVAEPGPERCWLRLPGQPAPAEATGYRFETEGHFPVDRARVRFEAANFVLHATLASRPDGEAPWRVRHTGLFYSLGGAAAGAQAEPDALPLTTDPLWQLAPLHGASALPTEPPVLELGWVPRRLTFVAQGGPPYLLAFGSAVAEPAASPLDDLLSTLGRERARDLIVQAEPGALVTLGGEARLTPPAPPLPWKTWALWAVLGLGLLLLAWMVRRLLGQLGEGR
jgi:hypothetical protein